MRRWFVSARSWMFIFGRNVLQFYSHLVAVDEEEFVFGFDGM